MASNVYTFPTLKSWKYIQNVINKDPKALDDKNFSEFVMALNFAALLSMYDGKLYGIKLSDGQPPDFIMCNKTERQKQPLDIYKIEIITIKNPSKINSYERIESELTKKKLDSKKYKPGKIILLIYLNLYAKKFDFNKLSQIIKKYQPFEFSQIFTIGGSIIDNKLILYEIYPKNNKKIYTQEEIIKFLKESQSKFIDFKSSLTS